MIAESNSVNSAYITHRVPESTESERLDRYLAGLDEVDLSRSQIQKLITNENILVNGAVVPSRLKVSGGEEISITIPPPEPHEALPEKIPLDIRYEDDDVLVVNKPVGMVTHPAVGNRSGTLLNALLGLAEERAVESNLERAGIIHRLDKNTSGLLIVARNQKVSRFLQAQLKERKVKRAYLAIVCGHLKNEEGEINAPLGKSMKDRKKMAVTNIASREALTQYQALERYESHTLLKVSLVTGRTHQIRVHLAHLGHPVFGDPDYGGREKWHKGIFAPQRRLSMELLKDFDRQALHAYKISFEHPVTGKQVRITAEPPEDFARLLAKLGSEFLEKGLNLD